MTVNKLLTQVITLALAKITQNEWVAAALYASRNPHVVFNKWKASKIYFKDIDISLKKNEHLALVAGYEYASSLHEQHNAKFLLEEGFLFIYIKGLKLQIKRKIELYILNEIFIQGEYQFHSNDEYVMIDIGMNTGFASLYFSSFPNIHQVYAYEPIPLLYNEAQINFKNNPRFEQKIQAFNIGIGKNNEQVTFQFNDKLSGMTSKYGLHSKFKVDKIQTVDVKIQNAQDLIIQIANNHPNNKIGIKIDCEGMEFEIFESFTKPIANNIKLIMLEWHYKFPNNIIKKLKQNNFTVIENQREKLLGMIYAYR